MPFRPCSFAPALVATLLVAGTASAHIDLAVPAARHGDQQKDGPCGVAGSPRSADPTVLQPGEVVTISWSEPVQHESHFRLAFLVDGDDFPLPTAFDDFCDPAVDDWCVADDILDDQDAGTFDYEWTVPETPCDNCTLQLIQVMYDQDGLQEDDFYYDCADVVILEAGGTTASATTSAGAGGADGSGGASSGDGGATGDGDGNGDGDGDGDDDGNGNGGAAAVTSTTGEQLQPRTFPEEGGCAVSATDARGADPTRGSLGFLAPIALALGALAFRRRR